MIIFIYILTLVAHYKYRQSPQFSTDGFILRGYRFFDVIGIVFYVCIYVSLFLSSERIIPAAAGLVWLAAFGTYCYIKEKKA